ncbi:thiol disulfide reductase thioredoxin [Babesia caballi]|uniref:Thiol disulfide reductase thioredoxin n=1 Tax=Babesia caballi TaxID=5871 RepID=A0AAV4LWU6_BABCB|nr:thiol disulfide reductase thioredoxin [Babesia caballi]
MRSASRLPWLFVIFATLNLRHIAGIGRTANSKEGDSAVGALLGPTLLKAHIPDISWHDADELLKNVPLVDHIVLFYIPLHLGCRQFMNLFVTLSQQFEQEKRHVRFVRVNCNGGSLGDNLCHRYNVASVPTVAYIASMPLQRETLSSRSFVQGGLRWCISSVLEDVSTPHATCYKGDLFLYQELKDWATMMYTLSQLKRKLDKIRQSNLLEHVAKLLLP